MNLKLLKCHFCSLSSLVWESEQKTVSLIRLQERTCRWGQEASSVGSSSSGSNSGFSLGGSVRKIFTEIWEKSSQRCGETRGGEDIERERERWRLIMEWGEKEVEVWVDEQKRRLVRNKWSNASLLFFHVGLNGILLQKNEKWKDFFKRSSCKTKTWSITNVCKQYLSVAKL